MMNISCDEGILLALYLEFFNRCYDPTDDRLSGPEGKETPTRQLEMQNIIYVAECLGISHEEYGFIWSGWKGPYSITLQGVLDELDQKYSDIDQFYMEYNRRRAEQRSDSKSDLADALYKYYGSEKTLTTSYALEDILSQDGGSDTLAKIVYIGKTRLPGTNISRIMNELSRGGYDIDPELAKSIWKNLALIGLRRVDSKTFTKEKRLIRREDGSIK